MILQRRLLLHSQRSLSIQRPSAAISLSESLYHKLSDSYLEGLADYFEVFGEDGRVKVERDFDVLLSASN